MVSLVSPVHTAPTTQYIDEMARTSRVGVCPGHAHRARRRPCREPPRTAAPHESSRQRDSRRGRHNLSVQARLLPSMPFIALTLASHSRPFGPSDLCPESNLCAHFMLPPGTFFSLLANRSTPHPGLPPPLFIPARPASAPSARPATTSASRHASCPPCPSSH